MTRNILIPTITPCIINNMQIIEFMIFPLMLNKLRLLIILFVFFTDIYCNLFNP